MCGRKALDTFCLFPVLRQPPSQTQPPLTVMRADGCEITVKHLSVFLCGCRVVESDGISSSALSQFPAEELPARVRKDSQHTQHGLFREKSCLLGSASTNSTCMG